MAKKLRKFTVHGAFGSKRKAVRKEHSVDGFIRKTRIKGHRRFLVFTK